MKLFIKKVVAVLLLIACFAFMAPVYAQDTGERAPAPEFSMYQYKDKVFNTDTVYGKKIVTFVFGSIT